MSIGRITSLAVRGTSRIDLAWDDGHRARIDLAGLVAARRVLAPLTDAAEFKAATLSADGWSVEWPSGIDLGAAQLRRWADEQSGEAMAPAAFRAWVDRHGFTMDRAADALGLSRRTIAYYLAGEQPVPKTVMLATEGYDRRAAA